MLSVMVKVWSGLASGKGACGVPHVVHTSHWLYDTGLDENQNIFNASCTHVVGTELVLLAEVVGLNQVL